MTDKKITVLGSGSWGTALAIQMARSGTHVTLWGRDTALLGDMLQKGENTRYLPGAKFPPTLQAEPDWDKAMHNASTVMVSVPSHSFRGILERLKGKSLSVCWATKGLELDRHLPPKWDRIYPQRSRLPRRFPILQIS